MFRVWLEFPTAPSGVPRFLIDQGVKIAEWSDRNEHPPSHDHTPDYSDERLVTALETFIAALGRRYDHDARVGYITAGLLGNWGEWHARPQRTPRQPRHSRAPMRATHRRSMRRRSFVRYPTGENDRYNAANASLPFGYHDDSFAWGTLPTPEPVPSARGPAADTAGSPGTSSRRRRERPPKRATAGTSSPACRRPAPRRSTSGRPTPSAAKSAPSCGARIFELHPAHPHAQDFAECVRQSHVTWLMDSGMFRGSDKAPARRYTTCAIALVRRMGYDFYVQSAEAHSQARKKCPLHPRSREPRGRPVDRDWRVELGFLSPGGKKSSTPGRPTGNSPACFQATRLAGGRRRSIWGSLVSDKDDRRHSRGEPAAER